MYWPHTGYFLKYSQIPKSISYFGKYQRVSLPYFIHISVSVHFTFAVYFCREATWAHACHLWKASGARRVAHAGRRRRQLSRSPDESTPPKARRRRLKTEFWRTSEVMGERKGDGPFSSLGSIEKLHFIAHDASPLEKKKKGGVIRNQ